MKHGKTLTAAIAGVIAGVIAAVTLNAAQAADAPTEKCYGVSKAKKNDCQTATNACAGTSSKDGQKDAWISVPKGTCEKIVGASLTTPGKK